VSPDALPALMLVGYAVVVTAAGVVLGVIKDRRNRREGEEDQT